MSRRYLTSILLLVFSLSHTQAQPQEPTDLLSMGADTENIYCPMRNKRDSSFGYDPRSDKGPASWGFVKPEYATCATGMYQSPIDFPSPDEVLFNYSKYSPTLVLQNSNMTFSSGAYNWAFDCNNYGTCGTLQFNGKTYMLANIHFHNPGEHTLNGVMYPLEAHMVHVHTGCDKITDYAVIIKMFEYENDFSYFTKISKMVSYDNGMDHAFGDIMNSVTSGKNSAMIDLIYIL